MGLEVFFLVFLAVKKVTKGRVTFWILAVNCSLEYPILYLMLQMVLAFLELKT